MNKSPTAVYEDYVYPYPRGTKIPKDMWIVEERNYDFSKPRCFLQDMVSDTTIWTREPLFPCPIPTKAPAYLVNVGVIDVSGKLVDLEYAYLDGPSGLWDGYTQTDHLLTFPSTSIVSFKGWAGGYAN